MCFQFLYISVLFETRYYSGLDIKEKIGYYLSLICIIPETVENNVLSLYKSGLSFMFQGCTEPYVPYDLMEDVGL